MSVKRGLGKGFGSLLPDNFDNSVLLGKDERVHKIALSEISPDSNQPRRSFDPVAIDELAQSIKRYGILQPLVVTESEKGYTIIAGERRFRAAKKAGLSHVPALVRSLEQQERLEVGLIENMQRVDLNPLDQAVSIARLHEQFSMDLPTIAARLGKAHTTVANIVRLLQLPDFAREALENGQISEGHARAVLSLKGNESAQRQLVGHIIADGWSVRQAEGFVKRLKGKDETAVSPSSLDNFTKKMAPKASLIEKRYGAKVKLASAKNGYSITLRFATNKEVAHFIDELTD